MRELSGEEAGRFIGADPLLLQLFEDSAPLLARLGAGLAGRDARVILAAGRKAHRAQDLIEAGADGGIGDAQLSLDVLDDAAVLDEDLEERELIGGETLEAPELEASFDLRIAGSAVEPRHRQFVSANRAATDNWVKYHKRDSLLERIPNFDVRGAASGVDAHVFLLIK